jgi:hypothetical protein
MPSAMVLAAAHDAPTVANTECNCRARALHEGVGLMACARGLNLSLNTVKRYARVPEPARLQRVPQYRPTLVDPFRDYLKRRRAEDPAVAVLRLLTEIKALGYKGSINLLYRYITQGRVEGDRPPHLPARPGRAPPDPSRTA